MRQAGHGYCDHTHVTINVNRRSKNCKRQIQWKCITALPVPAAVSPGEGRLASGREWW
jgi:hypothetical protein